jgi:cytoskeleton protein RodZ
MTGEMPGEMRIGEVLKQARARAGLDIRAVEDQTKIRVKYLRALEDEEWEALPNSAYAKGFLRTYAQLLGLDGEAMVDAYRRQVERGRTDPTFLGDQVLEQRRRLSAESQGPRWLLVAIAVGIVIAAGLLAIGILGDDDDDGSRDRGRGAGQERNQARGEDEPTPTGTVTLDLLIREQVQICLVGGGGEALIDGQVLNPGDEESYERERFELRFPSGFEGDQFELEIAGKPRRLPRADGPVAYEVIAPQRVVTLPEPPGRECP